ncbi:MAG: STAS domain-containing protein [Candidatus Acidiferrales bacterium]
MKVSVRHRGSATVLDVEGQITFESTPALRQQILGALKEKAIVLVNLTSVAYMDSSGIATLVEGLKEAQSRKAGYALFGLTKHTRSVMELVRLDKVFRIFDTEDDAIRQLSPSA